MVDRACPRCRARGSTTHVRPGPHASTRTSAHARSARSANATAPSGVCIACARDVARDATRRIVATPDERAVRRAHVERLRAAQCPGRGAHGPIIRTAPPTDRGLGNLALAGLASTALQRVLVRGRRRGIERLGAFGRVFFAGRRRIVGGRMHLARRRLPSPRVSLSGRVRSASMTSPLVVSCADTNRIRRQRRPATASGCGDLGARDFAASSRSPSSASRLRPSASRTFGNQSCSSSST